MIFFFYKGPRVSAPTGIGVSIVSFKKNIIHLHIIRMEHRQSSASLYDVIIMFVGNQNEDVRYVGSQTRGTILFLLPWGNQS